jgi:hypothetical protein
MARRVGVESLSGGDAGACGGETFFWWIRSQKIELKSFIFNFYQLQ